MPMIKSGRSDVEDLLVSSPSPGVADEYERLSEISLNFESYRLLGLAAVDAAGFTDLRLLFDTYPAHVSIVGPQIEPMIQRRAEQGSARRLTRGFWTVLEACLGQEGVAPTTTTLSGGTIEAYFSADPEWHGIRLAAWEDLLLDARCHPDDFRWRAVERLPSGDLRFIPK